MSPPRFRRRRLPKGKTTGTEIETHEKEFVGAGKEARTSCENKGTKLQFK